MNNTEIIQIFIEEVFNRGNLNAIQEIAHPNYRYSSPSDKMDGQEELAAFVVAFRSAFPDLKMAVLNQLSEGDAVFTRIQITGTHRGEFLGMPATGKRVDIEGCVLSTLRNGQIIEEWELTDQLTLLQQLGAVA
ncbi:ester cyclase [Pelagicoccus albus]|uniref:Ester cyclase n=1 Tax=Pelagicoccus albus TaxID=415222 RepID=A0A7X1B2Q2_9BACT|nr:ester cyclase [Pelagicoccus albus]MBC2604553.1 ester cyclase [Pelagicoccus albus]